MQTRRDDNSLVFPRKRIAQTVFDQRGARFASSHFFKCTRDLGDISRGNWVGKGTFISIRTRGPAIESVPFMLRAYGSNLA